MRRNGKYETNFGKFKKKMENMTEEKIGKYDGKKN